MLFHLLYGQLADKIGWLRVFRYPSTRILAAAITALVLSFIIGPWFIEQLKSLGHDDNAAVARMLARFLETKGHRAVVAHSGPEALRVAGSRPPPDLILLDLSMPGMDGREVAQALRRHGVTAAERRGAEGAAREDR